MSPPDDGRALHGANGVVLSLYESLAQASGAMLAAARANNADELERHVARCRSLIEQLKSARGARSLSRDDERRRIELLRAILADDAQIRAHGEPWLLELERWVGAAQSARTAGSGVAPR
jgi:flagellar protein FliT